MKKYLNILLSVFLSFLIFPQALPAVSPTQNTAENNSVVQETIFDNNENTLNQDSDTVHMPETSSGSQITEYDENVKTVSDNNDKINPEIFADYNELYGIEKKTQPQIVLNSKAERSAGTQYLKYLAVFIEFSDSDENIVHHLDDAQCVSNAETIFNSDELFEMESVNGKIKVPSFKKYYEMQSYGKLSITADIFPKENGKVASYRDPHPMAYYLKYSENNTIGYKNSNESLERERELINNAVDYVADQIAASGITADEIDSGNDGFVDAISFFVEGTDAFSASIGWGDLLWSHKMDNIGVNTKILGKEVSAYNLVYSYDYADVAGVFSFNRGGYGTIIHEFGHTLGYMDLYRTGASQNMPVGFYDIMGNSIGSNPQNFLAYYISEYNRATNWHNPLPVISKSTQSITLTKPEFTDPNEKRAVKIQTDKASKEYFVIEYHEKQNTYSSHSADESGIIVYRVNENNKYSGNKDGGEHGEKDHTFVFRPNETALGAGLGNLSQATLNLNRPSLGKDIDFSNSAFDNKTVYYSDGSNSGIIINVTAQTDNSVTFNISIPAPEGSGTQADPYLISDTDTFIYFLQRNTANKYYKLVNNIDFSGVTDYPKMQFQGFLDGNGKTISNINSSCGVFDETGNFNGKSSVENLIVENINANGNGAYLGGFVSNAYNCTLKNIHIKSGKVINTEDTMNDLSSTGGFSGNVSNSVIIENCSSAADVNSPKNAGGFIGINMNAVIRNCYANGITTGNKNIGGFIGLQCIMDNSYNIPQNTYFFVKSGLRSAVGGYAAFHNLTALPANSLDKGISALTDEIRLDKESITISELEIAKLTVLNASSKITWSSSNPYTARVDASGRIAPFSPGTTVITATDESGRSVSCTVTVIPAPLPF